MPSDKSVRVPEKRDGLDGKRPVYPGRFDPEKERRKFGRTPSSVGCDKLLSTRDKVVYWALAYFERNGVARTGIRYMASACGLRTDGFCESLKALESRGHIEIIRSSSGKRSSYVLLSPVFAGRRRVSTTGAEIQSLKLEVDENTSTTARRPVSTKLAECLKCGKPCKPSKLTGYCRKCTADTNVRRIAREEVAARMPLEVTA